MFKNPQPVELVGELPQYASNLYPSTPPICNAVPSWLLSLEEREAPQYTSYCVLRLQYASHLYRQYFEKVPGVGGSGKFLTNCLLSLFAMSICRLHWCMHKRPQMKTTEVCINQCKRSNSKKHMFALAIVPSTEWHPSGYPSGDECRGILPHQDSLMKRPRQPSVEMRCSNVGMAMFISCRAWNRWLVQGCCSSYPLNSEAACRLVRGSERPQSSL